jgi:hypothetical protein
MTYKVKQNTIYIKLHKNCKIGSILASDYVHIVHKMLNLGETIVQMVKIRFLCV